MALEFYQGIFGGELRVWTHADIGNTTICIFGDVYEWGDAYGDLVDRFGVVWGVNVAPRPDAP